jgi:hypothetical protein
VGRPEPRNSQPPVPLYLIGRDRRGHWVVRDQRGLHGGLFVDRAQALKFARSETGNRPQAIVMVPGVLELDLRVPLTRNR